MAPNTVDNNIKVDSGIEKVIAPNDPSVIESVSIPTISGTVDSAIVTIQASKEILNETIRNVGDVPYVAAEPQKKKSFCANVMFVLKVIFDVLRSTCYLTYLFTIYFFSFLIPKSKKDISGRLALITGAGNGFGREIAIGIAARKCNVVIVDLDLAAAEKVAAEVIRRFSVKAKAYKVDVSNYDAVVKLKNDIERDIAPVDILINNAGILPLISLMEGDDWRDYEKVFKINLHSHFWTTRVFLDGMKQRKYGHIVAISSLLGIHSNPFAIVYTTTKHGVNGFMACLASELQHTGYNKYVKSTCICPYFINTRKSLIDNVKLRFPPMDVEWAAKETVNAILKDVEMTIIGRFTFIFRLIALFPRHIENAASNALVDLNSMFVLINPRRLNHAKKN